MTLIHQRIMFLDIDALGSVYVAEDRSPTAKAILWTASAVSLVFIILRCYVRTWIRRIFGIDDALASVLLLTYAAIIDVATQGGLGRHLEVVLATETAQDYSEIALLCTVSQPVVLMACSLGKSAFAVTLLRLGVTKQISVLLWVIIISINVLHLLASLFMFLRCQDPWAIWMVEIESKCWGTRTVVAINIAIAAYSSGADFVLAMIPWFILWPLRGMSKTQRFGIAASMSLGIFAGGVSIIKTTYLAPFSGAEDFTYAQMELIWWAGAECALVLIAATIPTLKPLISRASRVVTESNRSQANEIYPLQSGLRASTGRTGQNKPQGHWTTAGEVEMQDDQVSGCQRNQGILETQTTGGRLADSLALSHSRDEAENAVITMVPSRG